MKCRLSRRDPRIIVGIWNGVSFLYRDCLVALLLIFIVGCASQRCLKSNEIALGFDAAKVNDVYVLLDGEYPDRTISVPRSSKNIEIPFVVVNATDRALFLDLTHPLLKVLSIEPDISSSDRIVTPNIQGRKSDHFIPRKCIRLPANRDKASADVLRKGVRAYRFRVSVDLAECGHDGGLIVQFKDMFRLFFECDDLYLQSREVCEVRIVFKD